jgi:hypothetical protein
MNDVDIDAQLRRRFAALRQTSLEPDADAFEAVALRRQGLRRRRAAVRTTSVVVAVLALVVVAVMRPGDADTQHVVSQPPTGYRADNVELLTIAWDAGPQIADPRTRNRSSIGPHLTCSTCPIVRAGDELYTAQGGRLYSFVSGDGQLRDIGAAGGRVFLSARRDALFVENGRTIEKRSLDGQPIAAPWALPAGWDLTEQPKAIDHGFVITKTERPGFIGELAWWNPTTGAIHQLGKYNQFVDAYTDANGNDTLAWTCPGGDVSPCGLMISNADASAQRVIPPPVRGNGWLLGGAFSHDGKTLATTLSTKPGSYDPTAGLALVDVDSGKATFVKGSSFRVGEPYGYVAWSPDGSTVYFGGLDDDGVEAYNLVTHTVTKLGFGGNYYSVGVLTTINRDYQCPGTKHAWQRGPIFAKESGDGLPKSGTATEAAANAIVDAVRSNYHARSAHVLAEPGHVWKTDPTKIEPETIYTVVVRLWSKLECPPPSGPAYWDGVPLTFVADPAP